MNTNERNSESHKSWRIKMDIELTHKLEFKSTEIPTLGEIKAMVDAAYANGFSERAPIFIGAGQVDSEHYSFSASVGTAGCMSAEQECKCPVQCGS